MRKNLTAGPWFICFIFVAFLSSHSFAANLESHQAVNYIGTLQTVCGRVVSPKYLDKHPKAPTFLNLDIPYPNQVFTALIWGSDRSKFSYSPEIKFNGKIICVSGVITTYKGKAQIIVTDPSQISF